MFTKKYLKPMYQNNSNNQDFEFIQGQPNFVQIFKHAPTQGTHSTAQLSSNSSDFTMQNTVPPIIPSGQLESKMNEVYAQKK